MVKMLTILFLCISSFASATTFYVAKTGNDNNNGSIGSPWLTVYKATSTVTTFGDLISISTGTYLETSQLVISVGVSLQGVVNDSTAVRIQSTLSAQYSAIIAMNSTPGTNGQQSIKWLTLDGRNVTSWILTCFGRSNVEFAHLQVFDAVERGVLINGWNNTSTNTEPTYSTGNTVHHCWMKNNSSHPGFGTGELNIGGQQDMTIYNNKFESLKVSGSNGWPIKYLNDGWYKNVEIYNNILNKTPVNFSNQSGSGSDWYFCIELARCRGVNVHHNRMSGGGVDNNIGYIPAPYAYSIRVCDNIITQPAPNPYRNSAISIEYKHYNVIIERNYVENFAVGVNFTPRGTTQQGSDGGYQDSIYIRKNLFVLAKGEDDARGIDFYSDANTSVYVYNTTNVWIDNNTMLCKTGYAGPYGIRLTESNAGGTLNNINIRNNVITNFHTSPIVHNANPGASITNLYIQNNDIYNCGNSNNPQWYGTNPSPLTSTGNINGTPTYGANYTIPNSSSILYNAGINAALAFNNGAADIGYHEFGDTPLDLPPMVYAGANQSLDFPVTVTLAGTVDDEGSIVDSSWSIVSSTGGATITDIYNLNTTVTEAAVGNHTFRLYAKDNSDNETTDDVTISVNPPNTYPIVSAGANQSVSTSTANLSGSVTNNPGTTSRNHVRRSENLSATDWKYSEVSVIENQGLDLNGQMTMDEVTLAVAGSGSYVRQEEIPVTANTTYYVSFDCYMGTSRELKWSVVGLCPSIVVFVNRVDYTSQVDTISARRVNLQFTTTSDCTSAWLILSDNSSSPPFNSNGSVYFGRVQVTPVNGSGYIKTNANPITTNTPAAATASWLWTKISGSGSITSPNTQTTELTSLSGTSVFRLLVTDNTGDTGSKNQDEVQVISGGTPPPPPSNGYPVRMKIRKQ